MRAIGPRGFLTVLAILLVRSVALAEDFTAILDAYEHGFSDPVIKPNAIEHPAACRRESCPKPSEKIRLVL